MCRARVGFRGAGSFPLLYVYALRGARGRWRGTFGFLGFSGVGWGGFGGGVFLDGFATLRGVPRNWVP